MSTPEQTIHEMASKKLTALIDEAFRDGTVKQSVDILVQNACNNKSRDLLSLLYTKLEEKLGLQFDNQIVNGVVMAHFLRILDIKNPNGSDLRTTLTKFFFSPDYSIPSQNKNGLKNTPVFHFLQHFPAFIQKNPQCKEDVKTDVQKGGNPVPIDILGKYTTTTDIPVEVPKTLGFNLFGKPPVTNSTLNNTANNGVSSVDAELQKNVQTKLVHLVSKLEKDVGDHLQKSIELKFNNDAFLKKLDILTDAIFEKMKTDILNNDLFKNNGIFISVYFYQFLKYLTEKKEHLDWVDQLNVAIETNILRPPTKPVASTIPVAPGNLTTPTIPVQQTVNKTSVNKEFLAKQTTQYGGRIRRRRSHRSKTKRRPHHRLPKTKKYTK